jgi:hypothetical protein
MGVSVRVARSRELVAQGRPAAVVARIAGISRQAIYRRPKRPPVGQRRPLDAVDREPHAARPTGEPRRCDPRRRRRRREALRPNERRREDDQMVMRTRLMTGDAYTICAMAGAAA